MHTPSTSGGQLGFALAQWANFKASFRAKIYNNSLELFGASQNKETQKTKITFGKDKSHEDYTELTKELNKITSTDHKNKVIKLISDIQKKVYEFDENSIQYNKNELKNNSLKIINNLNIYGLNSTILFQRIYSYAHYIGGSFYTPPQTESTKKIIQYLTQETKDKTRLCRFFNF